MSYCKTTSTHKYCPDCGEYRELDDFHNHAGTGSGKSAYCKKHARIRVDVWRNNNRPRVRQLQRQCIVRTQYGLSVDAHAALMSKQKNLCAICEQPEKFKRTLAVDHCHTTGKVRGLLCFKCNSALGKFKDSKELLMKAINYLETA